MRSLVCACFALSLPWSVACATDSHTSSVDISEAVRFVDSLPSYEPGSQIEGTIGLWGHGSFKHDFMSKLVKRWMQGFQRHHPKAQLDFRMYGTASAVGAVYTGRGNIALLGEEISPTAARAFEREKGYPATIVEVATGSLDVNFFDYAHMVFVHESNPIDRLSLRQLDAIFGAEHRRGTHNIRTWGELGAQGRWEGQRIQPYMWKVDEDFALFFREAVLEHSHRWNTDIQEHVHAIRPDGSQYDHGQQILDKLARDPNGIAISNVRYAVPGVKAIALAREDQGPFHEATPETLISQEYPLTRIIPAVIDRAPGQPVEPIVREFLRYILSRDGQQALLLESGYLPLSEAVIRRQLEKLQ